MAVAQLHNFCIERSDAPVVMRYWRDEEPGDIFSVSLNTNCDDPEERSRRSVEGYTRRMDLTVDVYNRGIRRPPSNKYSRA